jgi:Poly(ADP-ribose) polymerase catalytic domain/WGR domain
MANKLAQGTFPGGSGPNDFQCFGPPATQDGAFETTRICDMGCFTQDGKDSNKYYHAAVVQHKATKKWYAYFEWGRTGAKNPSFQFIECSSEPEAINEYAKQLHSKNDKRGEWVTIAGIRTLQAKAGKDCYLVRPMATRSTGLPDARSIKLNEGAKPKKEAEATPAEVEATDTKGKGKGKAARPSAPAMKVDAQTLALMRDLSVATIAYTRGSMADASLPTQKSIEEARDILAEAQKRLLLVGDDVDAQVSDRDLKQLTGLMYMRIPKKKAIGAPAKDWILSKENIMLWTQDLDAFESALVSTEVEEHPADFDPFAGMRLTMEWLPADSKEGKFLYEWWPKATANRHAHLGAMKIKNLWRVERHDDEGKLPAVQDEILKSKPAIKERPLFQVKERGDLVPEHVKRFHDTNTALLFHGTRSVNVSGILREALRLPKQLVGVVITGAMFGPGLYFADDWKKSAGYTSLPSSYWSGGGGAVKGRDAFMFAADVTLGSPFVAPRAHGYTEPPKGHHSVFGKAGASGVQNNEFIVYSAAQNRLRYLIEFSVR